MARVLEALLVAVVVALTAGCSSTNLADVLKAAGQDPASVCGSVLTVYGSIKFARTNITNGNVQCSQDGLTVKSDAIQVPMSLQVVPVVPAKP